MRASLLLALVSALGTGCYWSSPPEGPYGHIRQEPDKTPSLTPVTLEALTPGRMIVLGRFDSTAPQPIGGLYDRANYHLAPLYRTYYFRDGAVEVFEHVADALRAAGLGVLKDYSAHGAPALLEAPLRSLHPVLVTGTVRALQHDLIRIDDADKHDDTAVVHLVIDMRVTDTDGAPRLEKRYAVDGTVLYDPAADVLDLLGAKLVEKLTRDPEFVGAVGAAVRGA
jgi:hypothetical protein